MTEVMVSHSLHFAIEKTASSCWVPGLLLSKFCHSAFSSHSSSNSALVSLGEAPVSLIFHPFKRGWPPSPLRGWTIESTDVVLCWGMFITQARLISDNANWLDQLTLLGKETVSEQVSYSEGWVHGRHVSTMAESSALKWSQGRRRRAWGERKVESRSRDLSPQTEPCLCWNHTALVWVTPVLLTSYVTTLNKSLDLCVSSPHL